MESLEREVLKGQNSPLCKYRKKAIYPPGNKITYCSLSKIRIFSKSNYKKELRKIIERNPSCVVYSYIHKDKEQDIIIYFPICRFTYLKESKIKKIMESTKRKTIKISSKIIKEGKIHTIDPIKKLIQEIDERVREKIREHEKQKKETNQKYKS